MPKIVPISKRDAEFLCSRSDAALQRVALISAVCALPGTIAKLPKKWAIESCSRLSHPVICLRCDDRARKIVVPYTPLCSLCRRLERLKTLGLPGIAFSRIPRQYRVGIYGS
jgi:hypothetical protein